MNTWSNAFKIVFAFLMMALMFVVVTILVLQSDMTFQATASIGLKIEPAKKSVNPFLQTDDWMTLPQGDSEVLHLETFMDSRHTS